MTAAGAETAKRPDAPADPSPARLSVLRHRADFLLVARARRRGAPAFMLQARRRGADEDAAAAIRVGFTCSKKVGNAVARNRAKRRLREAARQVLPSAGRPGWDYVLVGRRDVTAQRPFTALLADLRAALSAVHG